VHEFLHEADHEWDRDGLVATWRHDVKLVRAAKELVHVKGCLAGRGARCFGSHAREETGGGGPDTRSFTLFGSEDAAQQRHGGVSVAVTITEFVQEIVTTSLVDARGELTERFTSKRARVHERRH
jgi:hypothetical protein